MKKFFEEKAAEHEGTIASILEEHQLRLQLRDIILEQSLNEAEDPTTDVHDNTGINTLKDLLKSSNVLSTLRNVYKNYKVKKRQAVKLQEYVVEEFSRENQLSRMCEAIRTGFENETTEWKKEINKVQVL